MARSEVAMALILLILISLIFGVVSPNSTPPPPVAAVSTPVSQPGKPHPEWLIDGDRLQVKLAADAAVKVVALTPSEEFAAGHIPGAAQIDWPDLEIVETSDQQVASWRTEVEAKLTTLGISPSDTVVIYDAGSLYAARLWWILDQLGHADKMILNGGLNAWTSAGGPLETGPSTVRAATVPYVGTPYDSAIATLDEAKRAIDDPSTILIDARTTDEYVAGHIPGAINVEFTRNADRLGVWKTPQDLLAMYDAVGATPDKTVIPYCSTGVRSAVTYFTLRMLGYEHVMLFTGSFQEWSSHPDLPVTIGDQP
jgi:thiosulfate/3-mercaptopyruvate sulfurtransferase